MSGTGVIIMRPMAEQVRPAGRAARKIRRTLNWVRVRPVA